MNLLERFRRHQDDEGLSEARRARIKAERELERTKAETPKYKALAASLVEIQQRNHLGLNAARMLRGDK